MFTFKLTNDDGTETTVKADSRDVLMWERTSKSNESYTDFITGMSLDKFYRLAHVAAKRQGVFTGKLADFEKAFMLELEEQEVLPTDAEASTEK